MLQYAIVLPVHRSVLDASAEIAQDPPQRTASLVKQVGVDIVQTIEVPVNVDAAFFLNR